MRLIPDESMSYKRHPIQLRAAALAWYVVKTLPCRCGNPACDRTVDAYRVFNIILPHIRERNIRAIISN